MRTEAERLNTMKAMAFDLLVIFSGKESYTKEEIKELIRDYIIETAP